jgi:hypothetical protein
MCATMYTSTYPLWQVMTKMTKFDCSVFSNVFSNTSLFFTLSICPHEVYIFNVCAITVQSLNKVE